MKIAIIAPSPVPYTIGGAEKLWWGLLDAFRRYTDHEIELIKVPSPERTFAELIDSYKYFARLNLNYFDMVISTKYPAWMVWHDNHWVYLQHRLRGLYDTYPADMPLQPEQFGEHWPEELSGLRGLLARKPRVEHRHALFAELQQLRGHQQWDSWFALPSPLARMVIHWLDNSALQRGMIRKYMAISHNVAGREGYFPTAVPLQVIHHPSDILPAPTEANDYFFTASRLDAPKRLDLLVRAMQASNTDRQLLIAGTGPQQAELQQLVADDERIQLLGRISDAEIRRHYGKALCVPFLPADEDYGLITVEAMQAGKPVLTCTDAGGVNELVTPGSTGWVVEPNEVSLTKAIEEISANPQAAQAMADACRAQVAHINWADTLAAILDTACCVDAYGFAEQGKPKRILVPLTFPVWPPRSGGQNRVFHLYRRIAQVVPVTLLTLCGAEDAPLDRELAPGLRELRIPKSAQHQRGERAAEREVEASISDLYAIDHCGETPAYMAALRELSEQAELVVASHPYLYRAIRAVYRGPIYYEAHNVELDMKRDILRDVGLSQPWLTLIEDTEGDCARDAIGCCACSEQDRQRLHQLYGVALDLITVVPNGVAAQEIPVLEPQLRMEVARRLLPNSRAAAVFMGSWHGPNIEAVSWIIEVLAPALPDLEFWIVGSVGNFWENSRNKSVPANVVLVGQLNEADKNAVLSCAQVAVNPMFSGSGSNLKMAEYAVAGLPVLSTEFGCRGLDLEHVHAVRVAELDLFAGQLDQLVNNLLEAPEQHAQLQDRNVLVDSHDWEGIADAYFAHVTSVFSRSVYNRRQDKVSAYPE
jgi:glycosyltransferase involved in cell wall biosynthesis